MTRPRSPGAAPTAEIRDRKSSRVSVGLHPSGVCRVLEQWPLLARQCRQGPRELPERGVGGVGRCKEKEG